MFNVKILKRLRVDNGYTQKELGLKIGISRETVLAIEKGNSTTMSTLSLVIVKNWYTACVMSASYATKKDFKIALLAYFLDAAISVEKGLE